MQIDIGVDFAKAEEDAKIKPVPAGSYRFQISKGEVGVGKNSGRPKINWSLSIIDADDTSLNERVIFYNTSLPWTNSEGEYIDSGLGFLTNLFLAIGEVWEGTTFDSDNLLGKSGLMQVGVREYEGNLQNEVSKLHPAGE